MLELESAEYSLWLAGWPLIEGTELTVLTVLETLTTVLLLFHHDGGKFLNDFSAGTARRIRGRRCQANLLSCDVKVIEIDRVVIDVNLVLVRVIRKVDPAELFTIASAAVPQVSKTGKS